MKKLFLIISILFFSGMTATFAQDKAPARFRELGLAFSNLDNFGLRYKTGTQKTMLRLTAVVLNLRLDHNYGRTQDSIDNKMTGAGAGFGIGFEKHITLVEHFDLLLGSDLGFSYNYTKVNSNGYKSTQWTVVPSLKFVFGAAYQVGQHIVLSAEITPGFYYDYGKNTFTNSTNPEVEGTINNFWFGFANNPATITLAYRFIK
jgi:hypothetical protein